MDVDFDRRMMLRAISLARQGEGCVEPNPMVGCVIVRDQQIVGEGFHARFGGPHAEVVALAATGDSRESTMYVSLEPCCHQGKTPPCTEAILRSGVQRVVVAQKDPFPRVAGGGIAQLSAANVKVDVGICQQEAAELNAPYLKRLQTGLPWVIAKWAMTLDGKIASRTGDSRWISGDGSRRIVHQLRGRMDAIIVGKQTLVRDDALLTARPPGPRTALRVVLATAADIPLDSRLVRTARETPALVAAAKTAPPPQVQQLRDAGCEVWLGPTNPAERVRALLRELANRGMTNVLVEGGGEMLGQLFDAKLVDEFHVFVAPKVLGGSAAVSPVAGFGAEKISEAISLSNLCHQRVDDDLYIRGRVVKSEQA